MDVNLTQDEIEKLLLTNPFDQALRRSYAMALRNADDRSAMETQCRILLQQDPNDEVALTLLESPVAPVSLTVIRNESSARSNESPFSDSLSGSSEVVSLPHREPVNFSDIAGMEEIKARIRLKIIEPFHHPGLFARFRKKSGGGILLYGPPGCGKTMFARAIANECQARFIPVQISDILSKWIGESEQQLRDVFEAARSARPSVLFFDELDALAYSRSKSTSEYGRGLVNEFLNQLDGVQGSNESVLILAASNMPWDIDSAMRRPGRFAQTFFIPPPDQTAREEMFRLKLRGVPCEPLDFKRFAAATKGFSGADIDGVIDEAKELALADMLSRGQERELTNEDFRLALNHSRSSTKSWMETAENLVKFGGASEYTDVSDYLKKIK